MIPKASTEGMGGWFEEELDEVLMFEEIWIGLLDLPNMEKENGPPSKEGKWIRKLLIWLIDNMPISFTSLTKHSFQVGW